MNNFFEYVQEHLKVIKLFILGYIAFAGCFNFPFSNAQFPFDFTKAYLIFGSYGLVALFLAGIYGAKKEKVIYLITLTLTAIGMLCRYLLEFGEFSNTLNFTLLNIFSYLLIVPLFTIIT